jgi:hypothetical protein
MRKFKKWLDTKGNNEDALNNIMRLYVRGEDSVAHLENCRLNPDFTEVIRNDLEFYIPQLVSFYLSEDATNAEAEALAVFIVLACKSDIYFCHRIMFAMKTYAGSEEARVNLRIEKLFSGISQYCSTEGPFKHQAITEMQVKEPSRKIREIQ